MSYSFTVLAATKAEAKSEVAKRFDDVVAAQPVHEIDRLAAQTAAGFFIDALEDRADASIRVQVHGSVSRRDAGRPAPYFTSANLGINVGFQAVEAGVAAGPRPAPKTEPSAA